MDWSHDLCSPAEQHLWHRLSLFPAGTDLDTAEEVCAGSDLPPEGIVDLIAALVDKSLLTTETHRGTTRYRMPDSIRAYGREHLTPDEEERLRGRLCDHYHRLVCRCRVDRLVPDQVGRHLLLERERPNIRVALESCLTLPGAGGAGLEIAATLWSSWLMSGILTEGRHWLDRGLRAVHDRSPARAMALWVCALLDIYQGDVTVANGRLEEALALAAEIGDESALAFALQISGVAAFTAGDPDAGFALMDEARARHRAIGDVHALALNLYLATLYCATTAPDTAAELGEELLHLCDKRGAPLFRAYAQFAMGIAACKRGDWRCAEELMRQVAIPWTVVQDRWGLAQVLEVFAWSSGARGDHERAARLLGAANTTWGDIDASPVRVQYSRQSHHHCEEAARRALGTRAFTSAFRYGARLGLDVAVSYALRGDERKIAPESSDVRTSPAQAGRESPAAEDRQPAPADLRDR
jgi:non-specific serine/threonine protein kinase